MKTPEGFTNCPSNQMFAGIITDSRLQAQRHQEAGAILGMRLMDAEGRLDQTSQALAAVAVESAFATDPDIQEEIADHAAWHTQARDHFGRMIKIAKSDMTDNDAAIVRSQAEEPYARSRMQAHEAAYHYPHSPYDERDELRPLPTRVAFAARRAGMVVRKAVSRKG